MIRHEGGTAMQDARFSAVDRVLPQLLLSVRPACLTEFLKKVLRIRRKVVDTPVGRLYLDPVSTLSQALVREGAYEAGMLQTLEHYLKPGGVFVDVGANEGYFTVAGAGLVGISGKAVAVEPQQRLTPILARNFELNGLTNIQVFHVVISDRAGSSTLFVSPGTNTGSTSLYRPTRYRLPTDVVPCMTLASLFDSARIDRADLLKMDIEGGEHEALLGSSDLFRERRIRALALELHPYILRRRNLDPGALPRFLQECGYLVDSRFGNTVYVAPDA
jgi:FkbM family methyltransferase